MYCFVSVCVYTCCYYYLWHFLITYYFEDMNFTLIIIYILYQSVSFKNYNSNNSRLARCCPCMKNGRCVRCKCVRRGTPCFDCWPSLTNPVRYQNSIHSNAVATTCQLNSNTSNSTTDAVSNVPASQFFTDQQSSQLSRIVRETHASAPQLTLTRISVTFLTQ